MLNYSKLKSAIKDSGYTYREFSLAVGHSENWIFKALKSESLSASDLENIAIVLKKPLAFFFDNEQLSNAQTHVSKATKREILAELLEVNKQILVELKKGNKV